MTVLEFIDATQSNPTDIIVAIDDTVSLTAVIKSVTNSDDDVLLTLDTDPDHILSKSTVISQLRSMIAAGKLHLQSRLICVCGNYTGIIDSAVDADDYGVLLSLVKL